MAEGPKYVNYWKRTDGTWSAELFIVRNHEIEFLDRVDDLADKAAARSVCIAWLNEPESQAKSERV